MNIQRPLILIGGGGHCKSVIEVAESAGYNILGILDKPEEIGKNVLGYKIVGEDDDIIKYIDKAEFIITVGFIKNPSLRIKLFDKIKNTGGKLATIIASTARVSKRTSIGEGTVIMHNALVNADVWIGDNVIINNYSNVEHDVYIGNQCHISTGAMINGDCHIGDNVFVGSQSVIVNGKHVCDNTIIGAGTVVCKNIEISGIYLGNPSTLETK